MKMAFGVSKSCNPVPMAVDEPTSNHDSGIRGFFSTLPFWPSKSNSSTTSAEKKASSKHDEASPCKAPRLSGEQCAAACGACEEQPAAQVLQRWPSGLGAAALDQMKLLANQGVKCGPSLECAAPTCVLEYGGEVASDGNCLFAATRIASASDKTVADMRHRAIKRLLCDRTPDDPAYRNMDQTIKNLYTPDLTSGWGVHFVQEHKLLLRQSEAESCRSAIADLEATGMDRNKAAESIYKERCEPVEDIETWAKYMAVDGSGAGPYGVVTLQYVEEGLLEVVEDVQGLTAAFGDDLAISALASDLKRDIYVVQIHGADAEVSDGAVTFFLPHKYRRPAQAVPDDPPEGLPVFLLMKGTGWCGAGGDHYEPFLGTVVGDRPGVTPAFTL